MGGKRRRRPGQHLLRAVARAAAGHERRGRALVGDDFSAYRVGWGFIRLLLRMYDGREVDAPPLNEVLTEIGIDRDKFIPWIYSLDCRKTAEIARYACKYSGYTDVYRLFMEAAEAAVDAVKAVARMIGYEGEIHYTGGMFKCDVYRRLFGETIRRAGYELGVYVEEPVEGGFKYYINIMAGHK